MQENSPRVEKKMSSAIASGVQDTCLSHQRESNQTDILFSINQVSKARQSTSFDINAVVTVVELMHSFLMEYHKSRFNAAKIMAAALTGEVSSLPAFPWARNSLDIELIVLLTGINKNF